MNSGMAAGYEIASGNDSLFTILEGITYSNIVNNKTNGTEGSMTIPKFLRTAAIVFPAIMIPVTLVGIIGNIFVIYVILRQSRMRTCANMLFLNLACADLAFLFFCNPVQIALFIYRFNFPWNNFICKGMEYLTYVTMSVSIYSLVAIGAFRCFAIHFPFKSNQILTKRNAMITSALVWLVMALINLFLLLNFHVTKNKECTVTGTGYEVYLIIIGIIDFILPVIMISTVTALIIRTLRKASHLQQGSMSCSNQDREPTGRASHRRLIITLCSVVAVFLICWLPFQMNTVVFQYFQIKVGGTWNMTGIILAYSNSSLNPIIYNFVSDEFRKAFRAALCWQKRSPRKRSVTGKTSYTEAESLRLSTRMLNQLERDSSSPNRENGRC